MLGCEFLMLLTDLVKVYDQYADIAGIPKNGITLCPIAHVQQQAQIEIELQPDGTLLNATVVSKDNATTIVPATIESANRTSKLVPLPLFDNLKYLSSDYGKWSDKQNDKFVKCHELYLNNLKKLVDSPFSTGTFTAIYQYLKNGDIIQDLIDQHVLVTVNGKVPEKWNDDFGTEKPLIYKVCPASPLKAFVRFTVLNDEIVKQVQNAWIDYYLKALNSRVSTVNYADCLRHEATTELHSKGLRYAGDSAKLISSNGVNTNRFTYLGRFIKMSEIATIGYETSQKASSALRWLIQQQGSVLSDRVYLVWGDQHIVQPNPVRDFDKTSVKNKSLDQILAGMQQVSRDDVNVVGIIEARQFKKLFTRHVAAISDQNSKLNSDTGLHVLVLDSATPGRLEVMDYRYLTESSYLKKLMLWYELTKVETVKEHQVQFEYPDLRKVVDLAYGEQINASLKKNYISDLFNVILNESVLPQSLINNICNRVKHPASFKSEKYTNWDTCVITVAMLLQYNYYKKEGMLYMTLNTESHDRSYNYGRLLAVLDSAESYALYQKHNNRSTNAQRYISNYMQRPATTFKNIYTAVIKNLDSKNLQYLQRDLDDIMDNLTELDMVDEPLTSKALLGFSHERTAIKKRKLGHS